MKTIYTKKLSLLFLLICFASASLSAADIYLAPPSPEGIGSDTNDGSSGSPVATLAKAYSLIPATNEAHIIYVSGFIDITAEAAVPAGVSLGKKYCTIDGGNAETSGFDGKNQTQLINLAGNSGVVTFKNLTFKNANAAQGAIVNIVNAGTFLFEDCMFHDNKNLGNANSSNIHIFRTNVTFKGCEFYDNQGARGGVMWMFTDAVTTIENCYFHNNTATNCGGVLFQNGNAVCNIKSTTIEDHDISAGNNTDGGAIYLNNPSGFTLDNCIIRNNTAKRYGGAIYLNNSSNTDKTIVIKNSLIAGNESTGSNGGGVYINNPASGSNAVDVSFINTTIFGNKTSQHGGGIIATGVGSGSSLRFINCTVTGNETSGNNGGFGGGVSVRSADQNIETHVYNSIFEGNFASAGGTNTIYSDFYFSGGSDGVAQGVSGTNAFFDKSIIGTNIGGCSGVSTTDNKIGLGANWSGLAAPSLDYIADYGAIPLIPSLNSDALAFVTAGNAEYLQNLSIIVDQLGYDRPFIGDKCTVGAVEMFNVTFNANEGTPAPETQLLWGGAKITEPTQPAKTSNTFGGWYKDSELVTLWDFTSDKVNGNLTLYAEWNAATDLDPASVTDKAIRSVSCYDLTGKSIPADTKGFVIKKIIYEDGSIGSSKEIIK